MQPLHIKSLQLLLLNLLRSCNSVSEDMWDRNWMEVGGRCTRKSTRPQTLRLQVHHRVFGGESPNQKPVFWDASPYPQEDSNVDYPGSLQERLEMKRGSIWDAGLGFSWLSGTKRQDRKVWKLEAKGAAVEDYNSHNAPKQRRLRTEHRLPMRP